MDKQQISSGKPVKITSKKLAERIEEQRESIKLIEKRKRTVYEAVCALSEPVSEKEMLNYLPVLDIHSWAEVIEERFLGKICGYPICFNEISVDFRRKFTWMEREGRREFLPTNSEPNKFCSDRCMCFARAIAVQLDTEEQQIESLRLMSKKSKEFKLPCGDEWKKFLKNNIDECSNDERQVKVNSYAEAHLVKSINELKVADNIEESSDEEEETDDSEKEEEQFLQKIKSSSIKVKAPETRNIFEESKENKEHQKV
ncbi:RTR1-type domain-containing protein [Meloidogyne graminicola]|uniref:RNA polymerase II subunit B1 CTD phosphatase RPAP2 homolog n=1 Tax=Meloidogyne graminicola TaxID=189291 RepID=A0A8S9ZG92_9BILA|nr:RTR1-type domain-containing protein [Meloidogyne graminicola]